ncbi:MAG: CRISPR-associated endonuclease Cas6 [Bacteroidales bacterium]|nr:CRISPR-associated endonuclease Cas6 [Bacteroidales bacterium]
MQDILKANILYFAKGIDWEISKPLELDILSIEHTKAVRLKDQKVIGFDINFRSNVFLPNYIGLGKSVSLGYGVLREIPVKKKTFEGSF